LTDDGGGGSCSGSGSDNSGGYSHSGESGSSCCSFVTGGHGDRGDCDWRGTLWGRSRLRHAGSSKEERKEGEECNGRVEHVGLACLDGLGVVWLDESDSGSEV
jgi:hypothetical protein